ncbi:MAG: aminodeoxychorismate synthase component I [Pseudomonadota bacterium]
MPLLSQRLPYRADSAVLFESIRQFPWPVFIDSARPMVEQGRFDILAAAPYKTLITRGGITEVWQAGSVSRSDADPFDLLREQLAFSARTGNSDLPFQGGAIGYFSYDLARRIERLPALKKTDQQMPELAIGLYDWALVVDHEERSCWLVGQGRDPKTQEKWQRLIDRLSQPPEQSHRPFRLRSTIRSNLSQADYQERFERIQSYIHEGDCYQVNFAQCFQAEVEGDAWTAYQRLRKINPAPFSAYLETPFGNILCSSPERFLRVDQGRVETRPIKGTVARGANPAEDRRMIEWLQSSPKDRAENLMIVDLLRNDLGRVCRTGSIEVTGLFEIESFARVHHLVSTVAGELAPEEDALSLLRACFPGGSITGAPKLRAMEIIEELEDYRRGVYCGAIGYIGFDGRMDTNIAIRTLLNRDNRISFWSGGGIVADSRPESEYQETLDKAAAIFAMLEYPIRPGDE